MIESFELAWAILATVLFVMMILRIGRLEDRVSKLERLLGSEGGWVKFSNGLKDAADEDFIQ